VPSLLMLASGVGLVAATAALWVERWRWPTTVLRWSDLDRRQLEFVFHCRLGRDRDRTLASYLGSCRHARSSLRDTVVSTVTEAAVGRTFSLA